MAKTTVATAKENGKSAFSVDLEVSGFALQGDEPNELGGKNGGPAPFDLLTAALAECTAMTVCWYARSKNIELERVGVTVTRGAEHAADKPGTAVDFSKKIVLEGKLTPQQREKLVEVAAKCPVQKVLERGCTVTTEPGTEP